MLLADRIPVSLDPFNNLYKQSKELQRKNKSSSEYFHEEDVEQCTFKPQINESVKMKKVDTKNIKGFDKMMERMGKARMDAEVKKSVLERGPI